jgi:plastocyanin
MYREFNSTASAFSDPVIHIDSVFIGFALIMTIAVILTAGVSQYQLGVAQKAAAQAKSSSAPHSGITVVVKIQTGASSNSSLGFSPSTITVVVGKNSTVTWMNQDAAVHTSTSNTAVWDSGNINPGANFTQYFSTPGTYHYHCSYHPWMTGTVIVVSS